jgi:DNA (cytosine-5)-methyltransferase 1
VIIDLFAGGGGASVGIEAATGLDVDIAVNHDATALAVHEDRRLRDPPGGRGSLK